MPTVAVVIPTHNRAATIGRAIRSVLSQSRPPERVLVIDDASTDDTASAVAAFKPAVELIRLKRNSERGYARNLGARRSSADLVAFLDSDDEWLPGKLEAQLSQHRRSPSITGLRVIRLDGRPGAQVVPRPNTPADIAQWNTCYGGPSSLLIDRGTLERVGGFPVERELQGSEDWVLFVALARHGVVMEVVEEPLVRYHEGGSTSDPDVVARSKWAACDYLDKFEALRPWADLRRAHAATAIARAYVHSGRWRRGAAWSREALRHGGSRRRLETTTLLAGTATRRLLRTTGPR